MSDNTLFLTAQVNAVDFTKYYYESRSTQKNIKYEKNRQPHFYAPSGYQWCGAIVLLLFQRPSTELTSRLKVTLR